MVSQLYDPYHNWDYPTTTTPMKSEKQSTYRCLENHKNSTNNRYLYSLHSLIIIALESSIAERVGKKILSLLQKLLNIIALYT